jgi:hypothetical protein
MGGEAGLMQDRKEKVAGPVTGKGAASAIGAMGARCKPERKDSRLRVAEGRNRSSPIFPIDVGAPTHARDLNAMRSKAWTAFAGDDLSIEIRERFCGYDHNH